MFRRHMHISEEGQRSNFFHQRGRTYWVLLGTLMCTTLALMLALQLVGQAGDTPWPAPVYGVVQLVLVHVL